MTKVTGMLLLRKYNLYAAKPGSLANAIGDMMVDEQHKE